MSLENEASLTHVDRKALARRDFEEKMEQAQQTIGELIEALEENSKQIGQAVEDIIRIVSTRPPRGPRSG